MTRTPVVVDRARVVKAFVVVLLISVGVAIWNDHRINDAKKDIARNTEQIALNHDQIVKAADAAEAARQACLAIGDVKTQIVTYLTKQRNKSYAYVGRIPGYTMADADQAEESLDQAIKNFTPKPCPARVSPR